MPRKSVARLFVLGAALLACHHFSKSWPEEQTIHYVLGDAAARVEEVDARWCDGSADGECVREVTFHYPLGHAPRVVSHSPRLANGDYTVELGLIAGGKRSWLVRRVSLEGGVTSIDLALPGAVASRSPYNAGGQGDGRRAELP